MKNSEYWAQRFTQLEDAQNQQGAKAIKQIEKQYRTAQKQIESQISTWYQRFAKNNGITLAEARQWIAGKDLKEFKWDVQDYIKHGEENALNQKWMKELENASAKYHISKLEALKIHTQHSLESLFAKQGSTVSGTMSDVYKSGYYHTVYELQKGFNLGWDIAGVNESQLEKVLSKPWAADGYNFSERIWKNKNKLISEVHTELSQNIILGADPQKAIDALAKKMNTSKYNAGRLVMTEKAYFSSTAQKDAFFELGVEQFEIVATLDSHTSEICRVMDGKHFPMTDYQPGTTAPPFHVWCRSTTVPYFDENFGQIGERAARDKETGKTYYIPGNMTYKDWEDAFVKGKKSVANAGNGGIISYAKAADIFAFDDKNVKGITPQQIADSLETTLIGREALKYLEQSGVRPQLIYEPQIHANRGEQTEESIKIFIANTKNAKEAAQTVIHELTHHKYNMGNCQWAEVNCFLAEKMHYEGRNELTIAEKKLIIKRVKAAYSELQWKKGGYFNGKNFK